MHGVQRVLENYAYTGNLLLQKTFRENHLSKLTLMNDGLLPMYHVERAHEAIIDQYTWDRAQRMRKRCPKRLPGGTYTHRLSGLVFCADCGARMAFAGPSANRQRGLYDADTYFQCSHYRNKGENCTSH